MSEFDLMIPTVDLSESDKLREQLANHPLYQRRASIEQQFLDELTHLTRKYGLAIKAETRTEYGETYPDCSLTVPYAGTEGRYVIGTFGIDFDSAKKGELLPCPSDERVQFEAAKVARKEEDEVIDRLSREISHAHYDAIDRGMRDMWTTRAATTKKPKSFACACGETFKTEGKLAAHKFATGHGNNA